MWKEDIDKLLGREVTGFALSNDSETLSLSFRDGGSADLVTEGDCCSTTWIESIDTPEYLKGTIQAIENIDMPSLGNTPTPKRGYVDEVQYYGLKITTDKGSAVIDYRNDSNGYYGGSINLHMPRL